VNAGLTGEVDELGGFRDAAGYAFDDGGGRAGDGDDGAIVGGVHGPVEEAHAVDVHGRHYLRDLCGIRALRKVGDTFDDRFRIKPGRHCFTSTRCSQK